MYTEVDPFKWNLYESVKRLKVTESKEVLAEPEYTGVVKDGLKHFNLGRLKGGKVPMITERDPLVWNSEEWLKS